MYIIAWENIFENLFIISIHEITVFAVSLLSSLCFQTHQYNIKSMLSFN